MHEIGMFQEALDRALACVPHPSTQHVTRVTVQIGAESGVDPDVIAFAFDVLTRDTIAAGAALRIEQVAAICCCPACGTTFVPEDSLHACTKCQYIGAELRQGREFAITALDIGIE